MDPDMGGANVCDVRILDQPDTRVFLLLLNNFIQTKLHFLRKKGKINTKYEQYSNIVQKSKKKVR